MVCNVTTSGAYAAQALCGMLEKVHSLLYLTTRFVTLIFISSQVGLLPSASDDKVTLAWELYKRSENEAEATKFREDFCQDIRVHFLGLWYVFSLRPPPIHVLQQNRETVKTTRQELPGPQTDGFVSHV